MSFGKRYLKVKVPRLARFIWGHHALNSKRDLPWGADGLVGGYGHEF
jgi:hypothetical protein